MSKTTNKFAPEVREQAIRMVLDHQSEYPSRWAAISSIAAKIGCSPATLYDWVKKTEVDTGKRAGLPSDVALKIETRRVFETSVFMACARSGGSCSVRGLEWPAAPSLG